MLLTPAELKELTGYATRAGQQRWLADRGWKFEVDRFGNPKVLTGERDRRMLTGGLRTREPDLSKVA